VFENRVLRRISGPKRNEGTGERRGVYRLLVGNLRERDHLEDPGIDGRIILRWTYRKWNLRAQTGSSWLRIRTGGGHF
jgi:hypothetical protein